MAQLVVDMTANAAYLRLHDAKVERTCEVSPGVLVDMDEMNQVVGIEVLDLDAFIPATDLVTTYHVRSDEVRFWDQSLDVRLPQLPDPGRVFIHAARRAASHIGVRRSGH